jgi:hypothetical protein
MSVSTCFAKENTGHQGTVKAVEFCQASRRFGDPRACADHCQADLTCFREPSAKSFPLQPAIVTSHRCQLLRYLVATSTLCTRTSQHNRHESGRSRLASKGGHPAPHPCRIEAVLSSLSRTLPVDSSIQTTTHCSLDQICPSCAPSIYSSQGE